MTPGDARLRLALIPGLGPITAAKLLAQAQTPQEIFAWSMDRLLSIDGVGPERARRIVDPRGAEAVAAERAACHAAGVRILVPGDDDWPKDVDALHDPPMALWMRGALQPSDRLAVAVVGPRRPSAYGHRHAARLSGGIARIGGTVVSGLARGIDTIAHEAALHAGGRTIAVLGNGLGKPYPEENHALVERIVAGRGAVLSEFPLATPPAPGHFPRRNRIVAALSLATLVVEAGATSGALITARLANEIGRTVLVLPGPVDNPECAGAHQLIRDGATLVASIDHILEEVGPLLTLSQGAPPAPADNPRAAALTGRERQLYLLLDDTPRTVDDLVRIADLPVSVISTVALSLELRRLAKKTPGGFVRAS
jgi:DNA processing protein